uniref:Transmembrane protein n=1 Tax=Caenorhabditis japonica TaxID=281687 RepID=A0A8R1EN49_CAEJA
MAFPEILEPEDPSEIGPFEQKIRNILSLIFRVSLAVFTVSHLFDFMFSSIWMHGYVWSLNLPIDLDMTDKPAGALVRHQLDEMGHFERIIQSVAIVIVIAMLLLAQGFAEKPGKSTWHLFKISALVGLICGFVRPMQLQQRFFSSLHEGFYCYFLFFVTSFVLTIRFDRKFSDFATPVDEKKNN